MLNHRTSIVTHKIYMGDSMSDNVSNNNESSKIHIDKINKDKMNFRIINRYPEHKINNSKDIEKRLFDVFKKYEKMS